MSKTERWPPSNQDEGQIRTEMLENPNSHNWKGCYGRVTEIVRWQMLKAGLPRNLEEDIVQEAMLRVIYYLPSFRGQGRLERWLFSIVRSRVVEAQRHYIPDEQHQFSLEAREDADNNSEAFEPASVRTTEEECIAREEIREVLVRIQAFIAQHWSKNPELKVRNYIILREVLIDDRPPKEVAQAHGIHPQSVYLLLQKLRRHFE